LQSAWQPELPERHPICRFASCAKALKVDRCIRRGFSGKGSHRSAPPPSRILIFRARLMELRGQLQMKYRVAVQ
jgi:hypothetical protein